jgi:hypothetical protein
VASQLRKRVFRSIEGAEREFWCDPPDAQRRCGRTATSDESTRTRGHDGRGNQQRKRSPARRGQLEASSEADSFSGIN